MKMTELRDKKTIERWFLEAARQASELVPGGEIIDFEKPDFKIRTTGGEIGIEVTELLRLGVGTRLPVKQESIHANVIRMAERDYYSTPGARPIRVTAYFRTRESEKYGVRELARELCVFVKSHVADAGTVHVFSKRNELHDAFTSIAVDSIVGPWIHCESGTIDLNEIFEQLASSIEAKNVLLPTYRERLPLSPI